MPIIQSEIPLSVENGVISDNEEAIDTFLFTSESVGEGHPGKTSL